MLRFVYAVLIAISLVGSAYAGGCASTYGWHQGTLENRPPNNSEYNDTRSVVNYLITGMKLRQCSMDDTSHLDMQSDGNLVFYSGSVTLWATGTVGSGATVLMMWPSGNLTLYASGWVQVWTAPLRSGVNSPIAGSILKNNGPVLQVQAPDGTVNWASNW